ncbi:hypothetical protein EV426DRAFT_663035 [Tirmania nivea]|nr:hypothetical protein EV426DRAFT_663035 [Tirmania nivea]
MRLSTYNSRFLSVYLLIGCTPIFIGVSIWLSHRALHDDYQKNHTAKCPAFSGNPDMYGIGVRAATYLQLVLTILVEFLSPKKAVTLAPVNLWFLVAFFVASCTILWTTESDPIEAYVIISLGDGICGIILTSAFVARPSEREGYESNLTRSSRYIVVGIWKISSTIFWWFILPLPPVDNVNPCGRYGWVVTRSTLNGYGVGIILSRCLNLLGWIVWAIAVYHLMVRFIVIVYIVFWKMDLEPFATELGPKGLSLRLRIIMDITCIFPVGDLLQLVYGVPGWDQERRRGFLRFIPYVGVQEDIDLISKRIHNYLAKKNGREESRDPAPERQTLQFFGGKRKRGRLDKSELSSPYWLASDIFTLSYTVLRVEFTIALNNIVGINTMLSAGQLIAVVVSLGGCASVAMQLLRGTRPDTYSELILTIHHRAADHYRDVDQYGANYISGEIALNETRECTESN